jgi:CRP/FNR family cyclic AMP-dependent transcriptional regulator
MSDSRPRVQNITVDMLRSNRLFQGVEPATLERLIHELKPEVTDVGDRIIREGDSSDFMFAVINGELEVLSRGGGTNAEVRVALLGPGDWVGEMALLGSQPRSATVRALAPSLLLRLRAEDVKRLIQDPEPAQYARILLNIACELGRRLRVADRLIAQSSAALAKQYVLESLRPQSPDKPKG